jgi:long-chain acyl-CoA synthetase
LLFELCGKALDDKFMMMRRTAAAALFLAPLICGGAEVAGVRLDDSAHVGSQNLVLNGAGLRVKLFFKVYVAGLYLAEKTNSAAAVLAMRGAKRVSMTLMRNLTAKQLIDALEGGLRANIAPAEFESLKPRVERLSAIMGAIGSAESGSVIALDYIPDIGTRVMLNGQPRGEPIDGEDFNLALLKIWLGDDPVDKSLKKALLGTGS